MDHLHNQRKILIVNCYRPPNDCEFISKFEILISWRLQLRDYYSVIVLGDFNYPGIRWIEGSRFTNCLSGEEHSFVNLLTDSYFFQLVESPTRINNILDLLIANTPSAISSVETGQHLSDCGLPSDHYPVVFNIDISSQFKKTDRPFRHDFKNADFESLRTSLFLLPLCNGFIRSKIKKNLIVFGNSGAVFSLLLTHLFPK